MRDQENQANFRGRHGTGVLDRRVMLELARYVIDLIPGKKYTQLVEAVASMSGENRYLV